jgi:hypothetical protein
MTEPAGPVSRRRDQRYTDQQLVEILRRAAERQEGERHEGSAHEPDARFSLAEIEQIASEVGIAPVHVASAAAELSPRVTPPTGGAMGAPTSFRFERWIDGELPTATIGELFDAAARSTGLQGQVTEALDTVEWRGKGELGATVVSVTRREGRTKIGVFVARTDAAALVATGGIVAGIGGGFAIAASLTSAAVVAGPLAAAVAIGGAGAGGWLLTRAAWRRFARLWATRADALGTELADAAQREVDAMRTESE